MVYNSIYFACTIVEMYTVLFYVLQKEASLTDNVRQKAFLYELCLSCCQGDNSSEDLDRMMSPDLYRKMWLYRIQERVQTMEVKKFLILSTIFMYSTCTQEVSCNKTMLMHQTNSNPVL